jgi:Predicted hydrolases or acyltransferases (alpha/beta hydrolase superfamily)
MSRIVILATTVVLLSGNVSLAQTQPFGRICQTSIPYGNNTDAGAFVKVNGISLHYEKYGQGGMPLLLIHGNGGRIVGLECQIAHFSTSRRVIIADSRDHGLSGSTGNRLTYEQIADDLAALLTELKIDKADVLGHSDGGIVALLLAIRHPQRVNRVVSSAPNLRPDTTAVRQEFLESVRQQSAEAVSMLAKGDASRDWKRRKRQLDMMLEEPHISHGDLQRISAPTLIIGADSDVMPLSHFVEIYEHIPQAQLFIIPGATHLMHRLEHELYNLVASRFLDRPFTRPVSSFQ